jgi:hypothetical protein
MHHLAFGRAALAAALIALAGSALAQEYPTHFAKRCPPVELQYVSGHEPCEPHLAVFGLTGPTIVLRDGVDVEATGSISGRQWRDHTRTNASGN